MAEWIACEGGGWPPTDGAWQGWPVRRRGDDERQPPPFWAASPALQAALVVLLNAHEDAETTIGRAERLRALEEEHARYGPISREDRPPEDAIKALVRALEPDHDD